ncbi:MAG: hypothetical protein ACRC6T_09910 [Sarcina sp.]
MFLETQSMEMKNRYKLMLRDLGSLSNIFSDSDVPYLAYRATENIFCKAFNADNLSRSDCSADAAKNGIGFGIKTFLEGNGNTMQKVAEFNRDSSLYKNIATPKEMIEKVAELRNERINSTKRIHGLSSLIYHYITRSRGKIRIFECNMDAVNIEKINITKVNESSIHFTDSINEYSFNISKSTLFKRFKSENLLLEFEVEIIKDPYTLLSELMENRKEAEREVEVEIEEKKEKEFVYLPLFSEKGGRHVPLKSGLNQWNAAGRKRNLDEIYIPVPALIKNKFSGFFPKRDTTFELILPDGKEITAKICQSGDKALMSNPNTELGEWLLRQVMNLKEEELLTYDMLKKMDIDSVIIYKEKEGKYSINFKEVGAYDSFIDNI